MSLKAPKDAQKNWERKAAEMRLQALDLREDLERRHSLSKHPKGPLLWSLAWQWGHAHGDNSIRDYYDEMAGLLK